MYGNLTIPPQELKRGDSDGSDILCKEKTQVQPIILSISSQNLPWRLTRRVKEGIRCAASQVLPKSAARSTRISSCATPAMANRYLCIAISLRWTTSLAPPMGLSQVPGPLVLEEYTGGRHWLALESRGAPVIERLTAGFTDQAAHSGTSFARGGHVHSRYATGCSHVSPRTALVSCTPPGRVSANR